MAYLIFIDESGHDRKASPYEVLAGIAIRDRTLWPLINELHDAEVRNFGRRYSRGASELKGKKLLKRKVFHHAALNVPLEDDEVSTLAKFALDNGALAKPVHFKALAQAKIRYVSDVLEICRRHGCKAFASIINTDAEATGSDGLRKDYAYLFERFFYFLEDAIHGEREHGIIVFDELEKSQSHILIDQAHRYFKETATGRLRSSLVLPEPFFVHSDLTTGIQIADLIAYIISWNFRLGSMSEPKRHEMNELGQKLAPLRYLATRKMHGREDFQVWSFTHIHDLRTQWERTSGQ
ncbi:MAG: DUF3800 domain-containing protein [Hyphomicrobiales bacterium]|nr:DUF3800 domain-containing protein [Hyphomicrobiales bacterium]